jgi:hypothetical protein
MIRAREIEGRYKYLSATGVSEMVLTATTNEGEIVTRNQTSEMINSGRPERQYFMPIPKAVPVKIRNNEAFRMPGRCS